MQLSNGTQQVHIKTTSISGAVSSASANDLFTNSFSRFFVVFAFDTCTNGHDLRLRVSASGTDITSSNYRNASVQRNSGSSAVSSNQSSGATLVNIGTVNAGAGVIYTMYVNNARSASFSGMSTFQGVSNQDGTSLFSEVGAFGLNINDIFDGITLIPSSGTITNTKIMSYGIAE